jgi:uncharacterized metal-binding protein YceD (DUF177 family)
MDKFRNYDVAFSGLKNGKHEFKFEVEQSFFDLFETEQEFTNAHINVDVALEKHSTFLDLEVSISGKVNLICDITAEEFSHPINNSIKVLVKFGEEYDDSNEEIITIPHGDSAFNIAQMVYEAVVLSIPMKKISPNVKDEDIELIEKFSPKIEENEEHEADPRWEALKKLKDKN